MGRMACYMYKDRKAWQLICLSISLEIVLLTDKKLSPHSIIEVGTDKKKRRLFIKKSPRIPNGYKDDSNLQIK